MKSGIYIIATPIGNLKDITIRALDALKEVDLIVCEDTRVTAKLLSHYNLSKKLMVYNDHSDNKVRDQILEEARTKAIGLVSDAGTPLISDPGYKLIKQARLENIYITTLAGASSVISAITISGLPSDSFLFIGFLPQKEEAKRKEFKKYQGLDTTIIFFERASRIVNSLEVALSIFGDIEVSVVREISKVYEEVITNSLSEILNQLQGRELKGEIVVLLSNKPDENNAISEENLNDLLTKLLYDNRVKDAAAIASDLYKISKKSAYEKLLKLKKP